MFAKHLMIGLMLSGAAAAQVRGAVGWFQPATPQDAETARLLSYDVALNFGLLKPYQTQVFTAPLLTPQGPQLPMDVLYSEGFSQPNLPEHFAVLQDALGLKTIVGGQVKAGQVKLMVQQGNQLQEVLVQAVPSELRKATLKKLSELLRTPLVLPQLTPTELSLPLQSLQQLDLLEVAAGTEAKDLLAKAFFDSIQQPKTALDQAYRAMLQNPENLLELNVADVPSLVTYQALFLEQNGETADALDLLNRSKYPYAKTLAEVIRLTRGEKLPENWPSGNRGVLSMAQAAILQSTGVNVKDTREALYQKLPNSEYVLQEYSFVAFDQNDFQTARSIMEKLVVLNPFKPLYWTNLGWAQYKTGNPQQALRSTDRSLQLDAQDEIAAYNMGLYSVVLGQDQDARDAYGYALGLGSYKDTEMAIKDLEESPDPRYHFYSGVLYEQLGNYPKALQDLNVYLASNPPAEEQENARNIAERVSQANCDFELADQPWFTVKGETLQQVKQGQYLQANFNVRCSVVLPIPVTVKYTLTQGGQALSSAEFTPELKPSTSGFRIQDALVPLFEVKDGELASEIQVTGANGASKTFRQVIQVQGQASLKERLTSADLHLVNLYGNPVVQNDPVQDLTSQVRSLFQDANAFRSLYPGLTPEQIKTVQEVTPEKVQQVLENLLARVGAELAPGSKIFFPDEYIQQILQGAPQPE